jgi:hypothetical protein
MIPRVGSEVDSYCTKCKMDLLHRVVAVLEARPKRVECLTCHSQHNYRKPKGAASAPAAATKPARAASASGSAPRAKRLGKAAQELLSQWESRVSGKGKGDFTRYSVKQTFAADQLLEHANFGQGYVATVLEGKKISVVFRDGEKVLAHARG